MGRLFIFTLAVAAVISRTTGAMELSNITLSVNGAERNYTGTVYQSNNTALFWLVNGTEVVTAFINVDGGSPNLTLPSDPIHITNESLYGFTHQVSGMNVTVTLTIKHDAGYGDVTLKIKNANKTFPMSSLEGSVDAVATTAASTSTMTTKISATTSLSETTKIEAGTESNHTGTAQPTTSTEGMPVSTTSETTGLPTCDVGARNCSDDISFRCTREITMELCNVTYQCLNGSYTGRTLTCKGEHACINPGVWGPNCDKACSQGCPEFPDYRAIHICDVTTGKCLANLSSQATVKCAEGWAGKRCQNPICSQGCNGGVCLAPNFCGNCPRHYESGVTCRNISLDGFSKGSLPTLAILGAVVIILKIASDCYERTKKKSD